MRQILVTLFAAVLSLGAFAQSYLSEPIEITGSRKVVRVSTDVVDIAMPVATLGYVLLTEDWQGLKQGAFTAAATLGTTMLLKYTIHKTRPDFSDRRSFPSGHTSIGFANAAFLQRRYGWKVGAPAYLLASYVGWGRIYSKRHDIWDVLAGAAIGAGAAYIFTKPFAKKHELTLTPMTDGTFFTISGGFTF